MAKPHNLRASSSSSSYSFSQDGGEDKKKKKGAEKEEDKKNTARPNDKKKKKNMKTECTSSSSSSPSTITFSQKASSDKSSSSSSSSSSSLQQPHPTGYIELKPFERLPKQLLHNYCQKHKVPKPRYELRRVYTPGRYRSECILPNPKDSSKTLKFLTEQDWEYRNHSEHFSALLALNYLEPTRPYERLFPSPFKEAWIALAPPPLPASSSSSSLGSTRISRGAFSTSDKKINKAPPPHMKDNANDGSSITAGSRKNEKEDSKREDRSAGGGGSSSSSSSSFLPESVMIERGRSPCEGNLLLSPPESFSSSSPCKDQDRDQDRRRQRHAKTTTRQEGQGRNALESEKEKNNTTEVSSTSSPGQHLSSSSSLSPMPFTISNARAYASEFHRMQEAEQQRCARVQREKLLQLKREEKKSQEPTVFMASAVRTAVRRLLFDALSQLSSSSFSSFSSFSSSSSSPSSRILSLHEDPLTCFLSLLRQSKSPLVWFDPEWIKRATRLFFLGYPKEKILSSLSSSFASFLQQSFNPFLQNELLTDIKKGGFPKERGIEAVDTLRRLLTVFYSLYSSSSSHLSSQDQKERHPLHSSSSSLWGRYEDHEIREKISFLSSVHLSSSSSSSWCSLPFHRMPPFLQTHYCFYREILQSCLDWLCLNTQDEETLPTAFNPRGKQIEVHVYPREEDTRCDELLQRDRLGRSFQDVVGRKEGLSLDRNASSPSSKREEAIRCFAESLDNYLVYRHPCKVGFVAVEKQRDEEEPKEEEEEGENEEDSRGEKLLEERRTGRRAEERRAEIGKYFERSREEFYSVVETCFYPKSFQEVSSSSLSSLGRDSISSKSYAPPVPSSWEDEEEEEDEEGKQFASLFYERQAYERLCKIGGLYTLGKDLLQLLRRPCNENPQEEGALPHLQYSSPVALLFLFIAETLLGIFRPSHEEKRSGVDEEEHSNLKSWMSRREEDLVRFYQTREERIKLRKRASEEGQMDEIAALYTRHSLRQLNGLRFEEDELIKCDNPSTSSSCSSSPFSSSFPGTTFISLHLHSVISPSLLLTLFPVDPRFLSSSSSLSSCSSSPLSADLYLFSSSPLIYPLDFPLVFIHLKVNDDAQENALQDPKNPPSRISAQSSSLSSLCLSYASLLLSLILTRYAASRLLVDSELASLYLSFFSSFASSSSSSVSSHDGSSSSSSSPCVFSLLPPLLHLLFSSEELQSFFPSPLRPLSEFDLCQVLDASPLCTTVVDIVNLVDTPDQLEEFVTTTLDTWRRRAEDPRQSHTSLSPSSLSKLQDEWKDETNTGREDHLFGVSPSIFSSMIASYMKHLVGISILPLSSSSPSSLPNDSTISSSSPLSSEGAHPTAGKHTSLSSSSSALSITTTAGSPTTSTPTTTAFYLPPEKGKRGEMGEMPLSQREKDERRGEGGGGEEEEEKECREDKRYPLTLSICKKILQGRDGGLSSEGDNQTRFPARRERDDSLRSLPVREYQRVFTDFMKKKQGEGEERQGPSVLILQGETGSGKTTGVPRMLLEAAAESAMERFSRREKDCMKTNTSSSSLSSSCFSSSLQQEEEGCFIICSQPRRLAAMSVASRVAEEMNTRLGDVVGYRVRLQAEVSHTTRLLFCTHGVLLRQFLSDRCLSDISVVVLDEVHERSTEVDLLLLLLSRALIRNPKLKVVIMSASISLGSFTKYFEHNFLAASSSSSRRHASSRQEVSSRVVSLSVPGRTYPVSIFYADEIRKRIARPTSSSLVEESDRKWNEDSAPSSANAGPPYSRTQGETGLPVEGTWATGASIPPEQQGGREGDNRRDAFLGSRLLCHPRDLPWRIADLVKYLHLHKPIARNSKVPSENYPVRGEREGQQEAQERGGAILIFMSGVGEVSAVCRALEKLGLEDLWILPCHASLHPKQQQKVFMRARGNKRKVVVATNIAETSITIADISYVIDSGLHKQMHYRSHKGVSELQEDLISRSSAQQRAGRAGRVAAGECYRFYERTTFERHMKQNEIPELHRQPLENVCLQLKAIFPEENLETILSQCLDPPSKASVQAAIRNLCRLGALKSLSEDSDTTAVVAESEENSSVSPSQPCSFSEERRSFPLSSTKETLTSFGKVLSLFPMNLAFARMLVYSSFLSCLDEMVALCALMAVDTSLYQSHTVNPDASAERQKFFSRSQSDFITNLRVFTAWRYAWKKKGREAEEAFCSRFGVNGQSMRNAEELRKRFARVVEEVGLGKAAAQGTKGERKGEALPKKGRYPEGGDRRITGCTHTRNSGGIEEEDGEEEEEESEPAFFQDLLDRADEAGFPSSLNTPQTSSSSSFTLDGERRNVLNSPEKDKRSLLNERRQNEESLLGGKLTGSVEDEEEGEDQEKSGEEGEKYRSQFWYLKACIVAGLYPQVAVVKAPPKRYIRVASGTVEKLPDPREIKFFTRIEEDENLHGKDTKERSSYSSSTYTAFSASSSFDRDQLERVFIHPSSINFKLRHFETQWVAFLEKVQTTKTFLKEVSTVPVFALLLLSCCDIEVQASCGLICLDGWIHLRCPGLIGTYVRSLKVLFDALLDDFYTQILANTEAPPGRRTKSLDSSQGQQAYSSTTPTTCSSSSSLSVDLFSGAEGERLRNDISQLVKRLVEYEGHRL